MRIENLRRTAAGDRTRIEAHVVYEDCEVRPLDVYFEAGPPLADALKASPEAFVLPGFAAALWEGERRLKVEGALDRTLADGLARAQALLGSWYPHCGSLALEPTEGFRSLSPASKPRAVALFSGGVDAFAMLCENRRLYPLDDPRSIRTVLFAFGYCVLARRKGVEHPHMRARYEAQADRIEELGRRVGFDLVRMDTNVRLIYGSRDPFWFAGHSGAFLASLVASPGYVTDALIASAGEGGPVQSRHGSHPELDVCYSTGAVRVNHMQPQVSRTDKVAMIADWEPTYETLQVCAGYHKPPPEQVNCGRCEKCVRTMVALLIHGALPQFKAFADDDVTPAMIDAIEITAKYEYLNEPVILEGLQRIGRDDLLRTIRNKVEGLPERNPGPRSVNWRRRISRRVRRMIPLQR